MRKVVTVLVTALVVLFAIFIIQNAQSVLLKFTIWSTELPLALLMILCAAVGFLMGIFTFSRTKKTKSPAEIEAAKPHPANPMDEAGTIT